MKPLDSLPVEICKSIKAVLCDIDDTVTTDGRLQANAYSAMEALHEAGLIVLPITGRPAGWCDHIARMWPVDGVVGENGAFYFHYDRQGRVMHKRYQLPETARAENREKLDALRDQILDQVPGTAVASDQFYREADLAIDFCEDVPRLPIEEVERIVKIFTDAGATAKISSIHVNGWFGAYDKLTMTHTLFSEIFKTDLSLEKDHHIFVGDSPNDGPMFDYFPHSVGVANVNDFKDQLPAAPRYVTSARSGDGFCELADTLLKARNSS